MASNFKKTINAFQMWMRGEQMDFKDFQRVTDVGWFIVRSLLTCLGLFVLFCIIFNAEVALFIKKLFS